MGGVICGSVGLAVALLVGLSLSAICTDMYRRHQLNQLTMLLSWFSAAVFAGLGVILLFAMTIW